MGRGKRAIGASAAAATARRRMKPKPELVEDAVGPRSWYLNGQRHRKDGPAVEWPNGRCSWWLNGELLSESEHRAAVAAAVAAAAVCRPGRRARLGALAS